MGETLSLQMEKNLETCPDFGCLTLTSKSPHFLVLPHPTLLRLGEGCHKDVIRVADIMKVIVITANVQRSQDTIALFASEALHSVPTGIKLIVLSLLT